MSNFTEPFRREYRRNLMFRITGAVLWLLGGGMLCLFGDFSHSAHPEITQLLLLTGAAVSAFAMFGLSRILFRRSWRGIITGIRCEQGARRIGDMYHRDIMVTLVIDRGERHPYELELEAPRDSLESIRLRQNGVGESTEGAYHRNPYYYQAPYKVDDTVVYLRGMKYPFRYGIGNCSELEVPYVVCPYCGEVNRAKEDTCMRCHKYLIK